MIRVDTTKIYAFGDAIIDIEYKSFKEHTEKEDGKTEIYYEKKNTGIPGLKSIVYKKRQEKFILELSSKILLDDYYNMITIDTVERVFDTINSSGIIKVNNSKIDQFFVYSLDVTQNIDASVIMNDCTPGKLINACSTLTNDKYTPDRYKGKGEDKYRTGIVWKTHLKENNERLIIYDKETEINRSNKGDKVSRLFWNNVSRPDVLRNKFKNIVRPEMNIRSKDRMREYLKTDNFIQILQSTETPLYNQFSKVKRYDYNQMKIFDDFIGWKLYQIEKRFGRETIIKIFNCDIELIYGFLRQILPTGNISRYKREYSELLTEMQMTKDVGVSLTKQIIENFQEQLKMAI
jgi:hypothetical protein